MTRDVEPTRSQLLAYALPALPLAAMSLPFYVFVPDLYTRELGLPIATVGLVLLLVRLLDAVTDPLAGVLADRTRHRLGRRRIWIALAAPLVAISALAVMAPPAEGATAGYLLGWAAALSLAWTAFSVPYQAWGTELSRSYEGRTRVAAFRESFTVLGTLAALLIPAMIQIQGGSAREGLAALALLVVIGLPIGTLLTVWRTPDRAPHASTAALGWRSGIAALAGNRPFRRLLVAYFINALANGLPAGLFLLFVADRLGAPDQAGPLLLVYFVSGVVGVPFWLWLARRTSKHRSWALGMGLACLAFACAPWLGTGDVVLFGVICVVTGLALGADVVLPAAVQGDVIDVDTAATGHQRAGIYLGLWALATKLAYAGAIGLAFPLLAAMGYDPGQNLRAPAGLLTLALLYAGLPVLLKLVAIALIWRFPLDRAALASVHAAIAARQAA